MARIADSQISDIRRLWASGKWRQQELATRYGVTQSAISYIVNERRRRTA
jgi:transcriptional regulator with XRE-family HTH domain